MPRGIYKRANGTMGTPSGTKKKVRAVTHDAATAAKSGIPADTPLSADRDSAQEITRKAQELSKGLQKSHDDLMRHMGVLLSQLAWGSHGITRIQALLAGEALKKAVDHGGSEPDPFYGPVPTATWVQELIVRLGGDHAPR